MPKLVARCVLCTPILFCDIANEGGTRLLALGRFCTILLASHQLSDKAS